jgi:ATP-dependent 26S proteasome regulatory subunit
LEGPQAVHQPGHDRYRFPAFPIKSRCPIKSCFDPHLPEERGQVAVIAATNRLEAIDPALCRPGRFDYHVEVPLPNARGRLAILGLHLAKLKLAPVLDWAWLVEQTVGYSGAELAALCREAGQVAVLRGITEKIRPSRLRVTPVDLQQAVQAWRGRRTVEPEATSRPPVGRLLDSSESPEALRQG